MTALQSETANGAAISQSTTDERHSLLLVRGCAFRGNEAALAGAALFVLSTIGPQGNEYLIEHNEFTANTAASRGVLSVDLVA